MSWRHRLSELKDTIAYVMAYAPDRFPYRDYLPPDQQMDLDRAFDQLREEFDDVAKGRGESTEINQCRNGIEDAYKNYRKEDMKTGFLTIQDVLHVLQKI